MVQFLLFIFDALAGFAMLSLGLAYTSDAEDCAVDVQLVSAEYFIADDTDGTATVDCAATIDFEREPAEVFRI
ncbi:hypothetical protein [Hyphobacterium sp.]|jgi:hypothetical protein|uniref:hypothetical protein n=1 Tax=Hyphobacterium sp. TaxID=2004662 RepID=UPI003BADB94D